MDDQEESEKEEGQVSEIEDAHDMETYDIVAWDSGNVHRISKQIPAKSIFQSKKPNQGKQVVQSAISKKAIDLTNEASEDETANATPTCQSNAVNKPTTYANSGLDEYGHFLASPTYSPVL